VRSLACSLVVAASALLFSTTAQAAAWNVPTNVRVVQKSNTDAAGRIYGTIQAAINSITNASATNPCLVRVMPGVYTENVTMKPFVSLVGSGQDATKISAAAGNVVTGASNAEIRDLSITSTGGGTGIYNLNAAPAIRNVSITLSGNPISYLMSGIYTYTNAPNVGAVVIENVRITILSNGGTVYGIATIGEWNGSGYNATTSEVRGASIDIDASSSSESYSVAGVYGNTGGGVVVDGTTIDVNVASGGARFPFGVYVQSGTISNSKITAIGDSPYSAAVRVFGGWTLTTRLHNTVLVAPVPVMNDANSNIKCVNAYGPNLEPVCPVP